MRNVRVTGCNMCPFRFGHGRDVCSLDVDVSCREDHETVVDYLGNRVRLWRSERPAACPLRVCDVIVHGVDGLTTIDSWGTPIL